VHDNNFLKVAVDLHEYEWRYFEGGKKEGPLLLCLREFYLRQNHLPFLLA
jgi:hypothetical protein